jgi:hypothetical protein
VGNQQQAASSALPVSHLFASAKKVSKSTLTNCRLLACNKSLPAQMHGQAVGVPLQ